MCYLCIQWKMLLNKRSYYLYHGNTIYRKIAFILECVSYTKYLQTCIKLNVRQSGKNPTLKQFWKPLRFMNISKFWWAIFPQFNVIYQYQSFCVGRISQWLIFPEHYNIPTTSFHKFGYSQCWTCFMKHKMLRVTWGRVPNLRILAYAFTINAWDSLKLICGL